MIYFLSSYKISDILSNSYQHVLGVPDILEVDVDRTQQASRQQGGHATANSFSFKPDCVIQGIC
jgi:hypothetical protein